MRRRFNIRWVDAGREAQCPPDPAYPHGKDIDAAADAERACEVLLKHPARRCGAYVIECRSCGYRFVATTAGRPDDPRSIRIPCNLEGEA